jgi:hypothetical protein
VSTDHTSEAPEKAAIPDELDTKHNDETVIPETSRQGNEVFHKTAPVPDKATEEVRELPASPHGVSQLTAPSP